MSDISSIASAETGATSDTGMGTGNAAAPGSAGTNRKPPLVPGQFANPGNRDSQPPSNPSQSLNTPQHSHARTGTHDPINSQKAHRQARPREPTGQRARTMNRYSGSDSDSDMHTYQLRGGISHNQLGMNSGHQQYGQFRTEPSQSYQRQHFDPAAYGAPLFDQRSVFNDISLPTVDSILSNVQNVDQLNPSSRAYIGPASGDRSRIFRQQQPHQSFPHSADMQQPGTDGRGSRVPIPSARNSFMPSFADFNVGHQRNVQNMNSIASTSMGGGWYNPTDIGGPANSIATSPSLVSALHAMQKRCRRLEDENNVLRDRLGKEAQDHVNLQRKYLVHRQELRAD